MPPLSPDHEASRASVRTVVQREIAPHVDTWDEAGSFPRELYRRAAALGLLGLGCPEALGGTPADGWYRLLQRLHRFSRLGTIDLRVDYPRPGIGARFALTAQVLRLGSRVASTRMEFLAEDGKLLATGAAAYIVS